MPDRLNGVDVTQGYMAWNSLRRRLRSVRHLPDRVLHERRRRRALERLGRLDVRTAVFICHGNINRSAYAAGRFGREVPPEARGRVKVSSAGFIGPNRPASEYALDLARSRGVDLSGHRSRLVDGDELVRTDLVVVMDVRQRRDVCRLTSRPAADVLVLGDLDPHPIDSRAVQDPYGYPVHVFERVFNRIDRCIEQLGAALWRR